MGKINIICDDDILKQIASSTFEKKFSISYDEKSENNRDIFVFYISKDGDLQRLRKTRESSSGNLVVCLIPYKSGLGKSAMEAGADFFLEEPFELEELSVKLSFLSTIPDGFQDYRPGRFDDFLSLLDEWINKIRNEDNFSIELLQKLYKIASIRDNETHNHTQRVGELSMLISERLEMNPDDLFKIRMTAPLHDLGKIGIPDSILFKKGPLDKSEWEIMKTHTTIGADILDSDNDVLRYARNIALHHHEKYDGSGYPDGIKGKGIPLEARIVTIADSFDAMMSKRSYKSEKTVQESIGELMKNAGTQFDPEIVDKFMLISDKIERMYDVVKNNDE